MYSSGPCSLRRMWRSLNASRRATGLEGMSCEEPLRALGLSGLENGRLWGATSWFSQASWGGDLEREVLTSSPWDPVVGCVEMVHCCIRGGLDWTLGSISLQRRWSSIGTGSLERWLMPHTCQCFRGIWTMPLITCFNFWSALNWSGSWVRWLLDVPSNWDNLFYTHFFGCERCSPERGNFI